MDKKTSNKLDKELKLPSSRGGRTTLSSQKPTEVIYGFCVDVFNHFNDKLFNGELSDVIITMQRGKNFMGYFCANRWAKENELRHELAVNPDCFVSIKPLEFFQTVVHEMVHQWQFEYGKPGAKGYHNKEWADKMEALGLMPSDTGLPGGKRTGFHLGDYPLPDGKFVAESFSFIRNNEYGFIPYLDRLSVNKNVTSSQIRNSILALEQQGADLHKLAYGHGFSVDDNSDAFIDLQEDNHESELVINETVSVLTIPLATTLNVDIPATADEQQLELAAKKQKATYQCGCEERKNKVWGSPGKSFRCNNCGEDFTEL